MINYLVIKKGVEILKKLSRIKLINWHLFNNQTIDISNNSLVSGENGAGKSTFLDALQYILTVGKAKFNTAANSNAKRDLEGYVRCKLGIENKTYLRSEEVTSHIALEFYDDNSNDFSILGAVIEVNKTGRIYERFYVIKKMRISDSLFIEDKIIRGYALYKKYLISIEADFIFCDTKEQSRKLFIHTLQIRNYKYFELITKALAFRPIDELNKFVFDFLLNERKVSIDDLRQNVRSYREFENLIKELQAKMDLLIKIENDYEQYKSYQNDIDMINILIKFSINNELINQQNVVLNECKKLNEQLSVNHNEQIKIEEKIIVVNKTIDTINGALNNNETYLYMKELDNKIKEKKIKIKNYENLLNDIREVVASEKKLCKYVFQNISKNNLLNRFILVNIEKEQFDLTEFKLLIKEIKDFYETIKEENLLEILNSKNKKEVLVNNLKDVSDTISELEKNKFKFDPQVIKLKSLIEEEIKKLTGKDYKVRVLCELLKVNDERWRDALEGYLNTQRFDLIVDPHLFDIALQVYEKYKISHRLYGVGVVNTNELDKFKDVNQNSLAAMVTSDNKFARNYVNMLLNNVICCEDVNMLKRYKTAITKTCMVYKNYTVRGIKAEIYRKPYIGMKAINLQLIKYRKLKKDFENEKISCVEAISQIEFDIQRIKNHQLDYLHHNFHIIADYKECDMELNDLMKQYQNQTIDLSWDTLKKQLEENKNKNYLLDNEKRQLILLEGKLELELDNKNKILNQLGEKIKEAKLNKQLITNTNISLLERVESEYERLSNHYKDDCQKIIKYAEDKIKQYNDLRSRSGLNIISQMNNYNNLYHFGAANTIDNIASYFNELNKIKNYELIKYEEKARESRVNCEIAFKEQFISKLRENIINAQDELINLNKALQNKKFGGDEYEFIYKANSNHNYNQYYNLIMSDEDYFTNTLFTETINDQNRIIMKELFDKLVIDTSETEAEKTLEKFTDYRNYMSYDIKIHHQNGDTTLFSKVSREKSGGETQTPFYVVIAASFEQLITDKKRRNSPACFVMFDEAFNNMDESRIQAMMEFYHNLNIQLMIAVPPQRIETIIPFVNTTLVVLKDNDEAFIESFSYNHKTEKNQII